MPRYKNKVGKIIELPQLSGKEMRALKLRRVITIGEHGDTKAMMDKAGKRRKQEGGIIRPPRPITKEARKRKIKGTVKSAIKPRQNFVGRKAQTMRKKMAK